MTETGPSGRLGGSEARGEPAMAAWRRHPEAGPSGRLGASELWGEPVAQLAGEHATGPAQAGDVARAGEEHGGA
jgi:hypothetical protein